MDYDYREMIEFLVDGLDLPEGCLDESVRVFELVCEEDEGFEGVFCNLGGLDALAAVSVFVGARQRGCPVSAEKVVGFVRVSPRFSVSEGFSVGKLNGLSRRYRSGLNGLDPVFVDASDYVSFYGDRFDFPVVQSVLAEELGVSARVLRSAYKEVVEEFTGFSSVGRVEVTKEGFGFHGDSVEGFALFLVENFEGGGRSPQVLGAAVLYIAGKLI